MTRKEHDWASRDLRWMLGLLGLLFLSGIHMVFVWVTLAVLVAAAGVVAARAFVRHRTRRNAPASEFWLDALQRDRRGRH